MLGQVNKRISKKIPASASGHDNHIESLEWSPSGRSLATGGGDGRTIVCASPMKAGQDLSPIVTVEAEASTSRLCWVGDNGLLTGRADGALVRLTIYDFVIVGGVGSLCVYRG